MGRLIRRPISLPRPRIGKIALFQQRAHMIDILRLRNRIIRSQQTVKNPAHLITQLHIQTRQRTVHLPHPTRHTGEHLAQPAVRSLTLKHISLESARDFLVMHPLCLRLHAEPRLRILHPRPCKQRLKIRHNLRLGIRQPLPAGQILMDAPQQIKVIVAALVNKGRGIRIFQQRNRTSGAVIKTAHAVRQVIDSRLKQNILIDSGIGGSIVVRRHPVSDV